MKWTSNNIRSTRNGNYCLPDGTVITPTEYKIINYIKDIKTNEKQDNRINQLNDEINTLNARITIIEKVISELTRVISELTPDEPQE